jgi:SAM-dependent methyltransferase
LCGGSDFARLYGGLSEAIGYEFRRCRSCGLIQHSAPTGSFADAFYEQSYHDLPHKIHEPDSRVSMFAGLLARLEKYCGRGRLLDVGCGPGDFVAQARQRGWDAEGLEPSASARERGEAQHGITIHQGTLTGGHTMPGDTYACVTFWNVIDQIYDPLETLVAARELMDASGIVAVRVPNGTVHHVLRTAASAAPRLARRLRLADIFSVHPTSFTAETLRRLLEQAGYKNIQIWNAPLSSGDPSGRRSRAGALLISTLKACTSVAAAAISGLSRRRILLAPSLLAIGKAPS